MRTEKHLYTFKKYNELTDEQKKKELKAFDRDVFYDNMSEIYDCQMDELFSEINGTDNFIGDRNKLSWESSSQGWYFCHCNDYLKVYMDKEIGIYRMEMNGISCTGYDKITRDYILDNSVFYKNGEYVYLDDVRNQTARKRFEHIAEEMAEKAEGYNSKIKSTIHDYDTYYPTNEEIEEYIIANDIEFLTDNEILSA